MRNSVAFAGASVVLDLALGLVMAWLIVRSTLPGTRILDSLAMLPLAVPGIVLAFGYLAVSLQLQTWIGRYDKAHGTDHLFLREDRHFLVTSRHVFLDAPTQHFPDRISFGIHSESVDLTRITPVDLPLYREGRARWIQAEDSGGDIDVAALELDPTVLPPHVRECAFTPASLCDDPDAVALGAPLTLACFPLGFYDTTYTLAVARQGSIASPFGVRFQGRGCFVTDARMHRGTSGAPVAMRRASPCTTE